MRRCTLHIAHLCTISILHDCTQLIMSSSRTITEEEVEEVWAYWFQGDLSLLYRQRWFPTGSRDLQRRADEEVQEKFAPLLERLIEVDAGQYSSSPRMLLTAVVVLDQFSRHVYRDLDKESPLRRLADERACQVADRLTSLSNWDGDFTVAEFVFTLMPYRHASTVDRLSQVMEAIERRNKKEEESMDLLKKFKKQTVRRLQHLQDRAKAEDSDDILEHHEFSLDNYNELLQEPLFASTKAFLEENLLNSSKEVFISLSGGVDSMVIAKILHFLLPILGLRKLVALHIDYANREESGREASFVQDWARRHGFDVRTRVVDEVTRGVTNRSDYEKISRQIRYGFYKDSLCEEGWKGGYNEGFGIVFGHHVGDIQENVISNIMRGCSPLNLAGMSSTGVTESVPIWRPLLSHEKSEILAFAHKYGVPYFKDTTPSWSTRGKLRNSLIPLLVDMYGTGCLTNIAALAVQSDDAKELVYGNVYKPFLDSVSRYPAGLIVNVFSQRYQPLSFWREMLKELMHSMGMSLVREKAVLNFVEHIQRSTPRTNIWMELRKNFSTYLDDNGDLLIFRDKVLKVKGQSRESPIVSEENGETLGVKGIDIRKNDGDDGDLVLAHEKIVKVGTWSISCEVFDKSSKAWNAMVVESARMQSLRSPRHLLESGAFSYTIRLDGDLRDPIHFQVYQSIKRPPYPVPSLQGVDSKLRLGLPFLIPSSLKHFPVTPNEEPARIVRLCYTYNNNNI